MTQETTTEEMDFIRAILANPDDDAPRLVFADYLDEQDDSDTATNIRNQCRRYDDGKRYYSDASIINWQDVDHTVYHTVLEEKVAAKAKDWRNGFVEYMSCGGDYWLEIADEMLKYHPIREVTITDHVRVEIEYQEKGYCNVFLQCSTKGTQIRFPGTENDTLFGIDKWFAIIHSVWNNVLVKFPYYSVTYRLASPYGTIR